MKIIRECNDLIQYGNGVIYNKETKEIIARLVYADEKTVMNVFYFLATGVGVNCNVR